MNKKDFSKAKIYKIVSEQTEKCYIGSTTKEYLSQRFSWHKSDFKKWKEGKRNDGMTSYQILQYDDAKIILLENFPCQDINELNARERYWIESTNNCVNKTHPGRTKHEYYEDNKDKIREKFECECGSIFQKCKKARHLKTKKHQAFLEKNKEKEENQNDIKDE